MEEKKLRKISKKELLEILLDQAKRIEELEIELKKTQDALNVKKIAITESGTLAEASLKLSGIFEIAQQAADDYVYNIKENCRKLENKTKKECRAYKQEKMKEVELKYQKKKKEADEYYEKIEKEAEELLKESIKKKPTKKKSKTNQVINDNQVSYIEKVDKEEKKQRKDIRKKKS